MAMMMIDTFNPNYINRFSGLIKHTWRLVPGVSFRPGGVIYSVTGLHGSDGHADGKPLLHQEGTQVIGFNSISVVETCMTMDIPPL